MTHDQMEQMRDLKRLLDQAIEHEYDVDADTMDVPDASYYFSFEDGFDTYGYDNEVQERAAEYTNTHAQTVLADFVQDLLGLLPPSVTNMLDALDE